ncbi:hypothetical protein vseg_008754 [Gypsophila vaccaria]
MALVSGRGSALNPNARPFIPAVYRQVEDFSSEWWNLVQNSAWFRDYWMSQRQEASFEEPIDSNDDDISMLLPDTFDVSYDEYPDVEAEYEDFIGGFDYHGARGLKSHVKPVNGPGLDTRALTKNFNSFSLSPKGRGPTSAHQMEQARYIERPVQRTSYNHGARRIHQPR